MKRRRCRHADDEVVDPLAFVPNLFDAVLVLTAALLLHWTAGQQGTHQKSPAEPKTLDGFTDSGVQQSGRGERLGTAYRLADGRLIYVRD